MADRVLPGPVDNTASIREAVCIHTRKIFDSCRDKDCVEDLRVYPTRSSREYIETAFSIRPRSAELLSCEIDVNEIAFNRGYYTVDCRYFYKVTGAASPCGGDVTGLAVFDKRVMLFGSEANSKTFSSDSEIGTLAASTESPIAIVEAVDPIALGMKIVDTHNCSSGGDQDICEVPTAIADAFGDEIFLGPMPRVVYVTLGQFSIIRLERDTQLVIPTYDYGIPQKECPGSGDDDPCELFSRIDFPVEEFFPPDSLSYPENYKEALQTFC